MKIVFSLMIAASMLLGGCGDAMPGPKKNVINYRAKENRYVILVVEQGNISEKDARKMARKQAKEITMKKGYRYYAVDSEEEIVVADQGFGEYAMEHFFNKRFSQREREQKGLKKKILAIRLTIECYKEKPCCHSFDTGEDDMVEFYQPACEIPCPIDLYPINHQEQTTPTCR